jgi:uncharacterized protein (TIGR03790 family)
MNPPSRIALALLAAIFIAPPARADTDPAPTPEPTRESAATVVVYNNLDPASVDLAAYYAQRRGIPLDHMVGLNCATSEEITRQQYNDTIADPLRRIFAENGWWDAPDDPNGAVFENKMRFVVLMRGIPLKIAAVANYPGDYFTGKQAVLNTNGAAVDSELATLGVRTKKISGAMRNPYYRSFTPFMDVNIPPIMLVCRLDGPTEDDVKHMIDGGIAAERTGLNGFAYIDLRGISSGSLAEGDQWLATAAVALRQFGMPVIWDSSPALFPADFPMDHVAIYLGWYADTAQGPMVRDDFQFIPGAVAVHIHSFSGATVRDVHLGWVGPLVHHGAAATLGNVYEPFLDLTPHLDVFTDRLRNGFNFAESAYASVPALSWMTTFVGDPLYRPFHDFDEPPPGSDQRPAIEYAAYREGAHAWYQQGRPTGEKQLAASARALKSGIVWEGLGLLQWSIPDNGAALASFRQAQQCYGISEDALRAVLHQVEILRSENKGSEARALAEKGLREYGDFHGASLLRAIAKPNAPSPGG